MGGDTSGKTGEEADEEGYPDGRISGSGYAGRCADRYFAGERMRRRNTQAVDWRTELVDFMSGYRVLGRNELQNLGVLPRQNI